jgi:diketogulonate reductase-like aldo/keto reductase
MKMNEPVNPKRRTLIKALLALGFSGSALHGLVHASTQAKILRTIPASGEQIPAIGVGTSRTFDAIYDEDLMQQLLPVLQAFFDKGGAMIDSSPMYGSAEEVTGVLLRQVSNSQQMFSATKVWTDGRQSGIDQMERSRKLWGVKRFDLMQIHNLRDWETHLETLKAMKAEGRVRYIGVTTSHGRFHGELEGLLKTQPFDFVQLSYNIGNRDVEDRLLPIARDKGIAVIVNRPFQRGDLFSRVKGKSLPDWASEIDVQSWAQYFLKFIIANPTVTCAIPATKRVDYMIDNMGAQYGRLPDTKMREEMVRYLFG